MTTERDVFSIYIEIFFFFSNLVNKKAKSTIFHIRIVILARMTMNKPSNANVLMLYYLPICSVGPPLETEKAIRNGKNSLLKLQTSS